MPAECLFFIAPLFLFYKATIDNRFGILQNFSNFWLICSSTIAVGVLHSFKPILHKNTCLRVSNVFLSEHVCLEYQCSAR
jgi:hypothetical protein